MADEFGNGEDAVERVEFVAMRTQMRGVAVFGGDALRLGPEAEVEGRHISEIIAELLNAVPVLESA